jgi:hypothetical protein
MLGMLFLQRLLKKRFPWFRFIKSWPNVGWILQKEAAFDIDDVLKVSC